MRFYGKSDIGISRLVNQDRFLIRDYGSGCALFAVFDGMGGANGGDEASFIALHTFDEYVTDIMMSAIESGKELNFIDLEKILFDASERANFAIWQRGTEPDLEGMGTTVIAVLKNEESVIALNAGDSRLYKVSNGKLIQVSVDNSYVQYLVDIGEITKEQAEDHPQKNIITKCLGTEEHIDPDIYVVDKDFDKLLLCSDGLTNTVSENDILSIITDNGKTGTEKVNALIDAANAGGGTDNITVVLAEND